jgi:hypothetical protein
LRAQDAQRCSCPISSKAEYLTSTRLSIPSSEFNKLLTPQALFVE